MFYGITINKIISDPGVMSRKSKKNGRGCSLINLMIELKVVSPQKVIFQKEVEMAVLPGAEGDFAAMENHSPFISSLRPGQMAIMANNQLQESFFVSGGLVMLKDKTCEVLVDQIESLSDVNSSNYQQTKTYQDLEGNESALNTFEQVINTPSYK